MRRDENGMRRDGSGTAVPCYLSPLPWRTSYRDNEFQCDAADGSPVVGMKFGYFLSADIHFSVHAANYHAELVEIIRRLAEVPDSTTATIQTYLQLSQDAADLLDEMKGGGE